MAHHLVHANYRELANRLNLYPQGAPPSDLLFQILSMLFSEKEAGYVALLPIKPFSVKTAAAVWKLSVKNARNILDTLAGRGVLLDIDMNGEPKYVLPPPMAGFFEFSMMRVRTDLDQKKLAALYYQYLNVEDDFIRALFTDGETRLGRVFVQEPTIPAELAAHVLDYERASHVIRTADAIGISMCYCRHKMSHLGRACDNPMDICMTFNSVAASLIKHGIARRVDAAEGMALLQQARDCNLVQFGENVRQRVNFICNCCGCCCEAMLAARRFGFHHPIHTTEFIPVIDEDQCSGCGQCVEVCPVEAISLVTANQPQRKNQKKARLNRDICLGCGVCVRNCPTGAIRLNRRPERIIPPLNTAHLAVMEAIERGTLHNFIFDNQAMHHHRLMTAILKAILNLPPIKQALASRQVKSRYLEYIIQRTRLTEHG